MVAGIIGFFYEASFAVGNEVVADNVFGILAVNGWHNLVHIAIGGMLLIAAGGAARPAALFVGVLYLILAGLGFIATGGDGNTFDAEKIQIARDDGEPALPLTENPTVPFQPGSPPGLVSENGEVAYTVLTVPTDFEESGDWGKNVRDIVEEEPVEGLTVLLSGDLGFGADAEEVFGEIDTKLLGATVILVLVLLGAIYRSVLVALTPLIVVFFAYTLAQGFIYLLAKGGATVSSNSTSILVVLLFGVGTDYCLLLVSRYREELHVTEDKHSAMAHALRRSGPAILASGLTVSLAHPPLKDAAPSAPLDGSQSPECPQRA